MVSAKSNVVSSKPNVITGHPNRIVRKPNVFAGDLSRFTCKQDVIVRTQNVIGVVRTCLRAN